VFSVSPVFIAVSPTAAVTAAGGGTELDILVMPQFTGRVRVLLMCPCQGVLLVDEVHQVEVGRATSLRCVGVEWVYGMPVLVGMGFCVLLRTLLCCV
jgi:hypothetical protein